MEEQADDFDVVGREILRWLEDKPDLLAGDDVDAAAQVSAAGHQIKLGIHEVEIAIIQPVTVAEVSIKWLRPHRDRYGLDDCYLDFVNAKFDLVTRGRNLR